ncbi:hypothetical protein [Klebsiella pneumoniae]
MIVVPIWLISRIVNSPKR